MSLQLRWDLRFLDEKTEKSYRKALLEHQKGFLKLFLHCSILIWMLTFLDHSLTEPYGYFISKKLPLTLTHISVFIFFQFFARKRKKINMRIIFLYQIYFGVYLIEWHAARENFEVLGVLITGIALEVFMFLPLLSKIIWKYQVISSLFLNFYLLGRVTLDWQRANIVLILPFLTLGLNCFLISISSYFSERINRRIFFSHNKDKTSLYFYENLIKNVMPSAVIILRNKEVVFQNRETKRLLRFPSSTKTKDILNQISVYDVKNEDKSLFPSLQFNKEKTEKSELKLDEFLTKTNENDFICGFQQIVGTVNDFKSIISGNNINPDELRFLDIKVSKIMWDGAESTIVIMTEDLRIQIMNKLADQSKYKDMLLATVSHDLRTPLNGVIGIIEITL